MSSTFVHYSPEIETIDPDLNEYMTRIIDFWEKTVRESPLREGTGHAVRGAHAKTLGVVKAEVEILGAAPAPYAQGIYAKPGHHGALIRFSSASNHLGPDAQLGPVLGFATQRAAHARHRTYTAEQVIVAAHAYGSAKLLHHMQHAGHLTGLSSQLGQRARPSPA